MQRRNKQSFMSERQKYSGRGAGELKQNTRYFLQSIMTDGVFTTTGHQTKARKTWEFLCHGNPSFERTPLPWPPSSLGPGENCTPNRSPSDRRNTANNLTCVYCVQRMEANIATQLWHRSGINSANVTCLHRNQDFVYYWLRADRPRFDSQQ